MISGKVDNQKSAVITLTIRGFGGEVVEVDAIIDTGFNGAIALRPEDIIALNLLPSGTVDSELADGTLKTVTTYYAIADWGGIQRLVEIIGDDPVPLIGMDMLTGYNLSIDVLDGGTVTIVRL